MVEFCEAIIWHDNKQIRSLIPCKLCKWWRHDGTGGGNQRFFASVSSDMPPLQPSPVPNSSHVPDRFLVSIEDVEKLLSQINPKKSSGPDDIPSWVLRDFSVWLAKPICHLFNTSVIEGYLPSVWKSANVVAIPKTTPARAIESDLRPISKKLQLPYDWKGICGSIVTFSGVLCQREW